jgi:hypothetical protein
MLPTLTSNHVEEVLRDCLLADDEAEIDPDVVVIVEGILNPFAFQVEGLERNRKLIAGMLAELPREFMAVKTGGGGGWSFLNACMRRDGVQWTGLHRTMDWLLSLGQACGYVTCQLPREMWASMPGGMPYYVIELPQEGVGPPDPIGPAGELGQAGEP